MFASTTATDAERAVPRPGDDLVAPADVTMDRAFTLDAPPQIVWPWLVQLGKARAGWYLPRSVERFVPPGRRAARRILPQWQALAVGEVIPDYGGKNETFRVEQLQRPASIVYTSQRGRTTVSWSITLEPDSDDVSRRTRVFLRLCAAPVRRKRLMETGGEFFDALTVALMVAGLRERLAEASVVSGSLAPTSRGR
ncbi:hypothetical protein [Allobranchiibius sp. CTAmp26]|uniref:hypothetical protein n=1 Tax=Allobranchiibius sp. CTAmp26 TaxID=2815214 RepID=UPI001AA10704|nr:hypothetical protein [Allobranchiibius sp. CTAmp26]MBO1755117.1 hypothetical protein [Allobranchiibius sp. CTAmp26]